MKNFIIILQPISRLPFTFIFKTLVLDIKNIYIRIILCQYIKKSKLNIFQYRFISISLILNKLKANVNNALNIFKMLNLFLNDRLCFIYYIKSNH